MHKRCNRCGEVKPRGEFHNMKSASDGKQPKCKCCVAEYARGKREHLRLYKQGYREANREKIRETERIRNLEKKYRLTQDQFDDIFASQGNCCAICRTTEPGKNNWHVDHDHSCCPGKYTCGECIRGILCARCNICIGMLNDDADLLSIASAYIANARRRPLIHGPNPQ